MTQKMYEEIPFAVTKLSAALVDVAPLMRIRYVGPYESCTIETDADCDAITFKVGVLGSEAVDSTIGSSGVIDVTTATGTNNVFSELLNTINANPNYRAVVECAKDTDTVEGGGTAAGQAATQAAIRGGAAIVSDTTVFGNTGFLIGNDDVDGNMSVGRQYGFDTVQATITNAASTAASLLIKLYSINPWTGASTLLYTGTYVTATALLLNNADWGPDTLWGNPGESLLVQIEEGSGGTPDITAAIVNVTGRYKLIGTGRVKTFKVDQF